MRFMVSFLSVFYNYSILSYVLKHKNRRIGGFCAKSNLSEALPCRFFDCDSVFSDEFIGGNGNIHFGDVGVGVLGGGEIIAPDRFGGK